MNPRELSRVDTGRARPLTSRAAIKKWKALNEFFALFSAINSKLNSHGALLRRDLNIIGRRAKQGAPGKMFHDF